MRSNLLASAVVAGLAITGLAVPGQSRAQTVTKAEVEALQAQIAQLQAQVQQLQARSDAQSEVNVAQAKTNESVQASQDKVDALAKTVNDTQLSGRMFFDLTNINQQDHGVDTDASGNGFDVNAVLQAQAQCAPGSFSGRGLTLVRSLADRCQWSADGKSVSVEFFWSAQA